MGEKREVDRADEPRTYAKEVPNGACSCHALAHTDLAGKPLHNTMAKYKAFGDSSRVLADEPQS